jgi:hypothetical protein
LLFQTVVFATFCTISSSSAICRELIPCSTANRQNLPHPCLQPGFKN